MQRKDIAERLAEVGYVADSQLAMALWLMESLQRPLLLEGATQTSFARILASIVLIGAAGWFFLGRYGLLMNSHAFMTGMDWLDENVSLPLRWVVLQP